MATDNGTTERSGTPPSFDVDLQDAADLDVAIKIGKAWRDLRRGESSSVVRDYFFGTDIDAGQMDTLDVLVHKSSWRMSALAAALRVDPSTATRAVQRLVGVGLATRRTDDDDGRVVMVTVTDAGRDLHCRIDKRRAYVISRLMGAFAPDERAELASLLTRFVDELDIVVKDLPAERPAD